MGIATARAGDRRGDEAAADAEEGDDGERAVPEPALGVGVEGERQEEKRVDGGAEDDRGRDRRGQVGDREPDADQNQAHHHVVEVDLADPLRGDDADPAQQLRALLADHHRPAEQAADRQLHQADLDHPVHRRP